MILAFKKRNLTRFIFLFTFILLLTPLIFFMIKPNPNQSLIMGKAEMYVQNLAGMKEFYVDLVGLKVIKQEENLIELGFENKNIITLIQKDGFSFENANEAGLYHNAIVFETRTALAQAINRVLVATPEIYQGSADHLVSEAFYFADPEGNGVELYFDKPRSSWQYDSNGKPVMGGIYINEKEYIKTHINAHNSPIDIKMGHIHLKVGDIQTAKRFYVDVLKFDIIRLSDDSLFISRDGYHHHIGMNTWQSLGAGMRRENVYGLYSFELKVDSEYFKEIKNSLKNNSLVIPEDSQESFETKDPWGNVIKIKKINL